MAVTEETAEETETAEAIAADREGITAAAIAGDIIKTEETAEKRKRKARSASALISETASKTKID